VIRHALLALLRERSDHGYQLKHRFESLVGPSWRLNIGQVYQALRALEMRRHVVEVRDGAHASGPSVSFPERTRRRFGITQEGVRALDRWLVRPPAGIQPIRDELVVKLLGLAGDRREACATLLAARQRVYRKHLKGLLALRDRHASDPRTATVTTLAVEGQLLLVRAYLEWLELCLHTLSADVPNGEAQPATRARGAGA
jgi:DNA-binding PadR family transcriptional regulator